MLEGVGGEIRWYYQLYHIICSHLSSSELNMTKLDVMIGGWISMIASTDFNVAEQFTYRLVGNLAMTSWPAR